MSALHNDRSKAVASWFLGPRGENFEYLAKFINKALDTQRAGRLEYFPNDPPRIDKETQDSSQFKESMKKLEALVETSSKFLIEHSVPFWNPRYNAHMLMDTTLPGIVGYIMTMLFNPNNVAIEASPWSTKIEQEVGKQLCGMIGIGEEKGWGHITCDGSVANLEALWAARNLKFYPLSLTLAIEKGDLDFLRDTFITYTCDGTEKLFSTFTPWELLNMAPDTVLSIPDQLYQKYLISPTFLQNAMQPYVIQSTPRDDPMFVTRFEVDGIRLDNICLMTSATKHYSWPKGAAITGIGASNLINIQVDLNARLDTDSLRKELDQCLEQKRAVYAVVAIIGSTEHGACDPLEDIVAIRAEYQSKGLNFSLHADGAWGAYYHTMLNRTKESGDTVHSHDFVPSMPLKESTIQSLRHLRFCETITVDPHKSGYIQYPAGSLLYRDGRLRYIITWTSPVINRPDEESVGVYGVEGSKPGASPVAVWMSHQVIGLDKNGYGALLGEGVFGAVKMYAHLSTMSTSHTEFRLTMLNMLPSEAAGGKVEAEKQFIRKRILNKINEDLVQDAQAMDLLKRMGSDLSINTFAVNFRANGKINQDIIEANDLNTRIFKRLSITSVKDDLNARPLILTSTVLSQATYGKCLNNFKERLGLVGDQDLYTLINVVSSPFPTEGNFTSEISKALRQIIEEEVVISAFRNTIAPNTHGFVMQGTSSVHFVYLPMFNMAGHRCQLIITGDLPEDVLKQYTAARLAHPGIYFTLANAKPAVLTEMIEAGKFEAVIDICMPPDDGSHLISGFSIVNVRVVVMAELGTSQLTSYPAKTMPFYVYGDSAKDEWHITHAILAAPNIQLSSEQVKLGPAIASQLRRSGSEYLVLHVRLPEAAMQPFPSNADIVKLNPFFFRPAAVLDSMAVLSPGMDPKDVLARGSLQLSQTVFVDTDMLNMDPEPHHSLKAAGKDGKALLELWTDPAYHDETGGDAGQDTSKEPPLRGSFKHYSEKSTARHSSTPLLGDIEPSLGLEYLKSLKGAFQKSEE